VLDLSEFRPELKDVAEFRNYAEVYASPSHPPSYASYTRSLALLDRTLQHDDPRARTPRTHVLLLFQSLG
jgi:hypothetical protein